MPSSAGASLVVIYKHPDPSRPLKSVVIYNGLYAQTKDSKTKTIDSMTQRIGGFYQLAASPGLKMTHLVGSGAGNTSERLWVGDDAQNLARIATNPFPAAGSPSSDRAWDAPTFPLAISAADGEYAIKVDHSSNSPYDCLSWVAIVSSATVEDTDKDGLLNQWETDGRYQKITYDAAGDVTDALFGMCTGNICLQSRQLRGFSEDGSVAASQRHLRRVRLHAGARGDDVRNHLAERRSGARPSGRSRGAGKGRQGLRQRASRNQGALRSRRRLSDWNGRGAMPHSGHHRCRPGARRRGDRRDNLQSGRKSLYLSVSGVSGNRSWKTGFRFLRDESLSHRKIVGGVDKGPDDAACVAAETDRFDATTCVRRFDSNRKDTFRYGLWAHALGLPKVDDSGVPLVDAGSYIPRNISGVADGGGSGGGDFMITLGAFGSDVGNESVQAQASTFMHELGHTLRLRHGAVLGANGIPMAGSELQTELSERHELSLPDWRPDRRQRPARGHARHRLLASGAERAGGDAVRPEAQRKQSERSARFGFEGRRGVTVPIRAQMVFARQSSVRPRATP